MLKRVEEEEKSAQRKEETERKIDIRNRRSRRMDNHFWAIFSVLGFIVLWIVGIISYRVWKSKCPLCGSLVVDAGYDECLHCTECPWSEFGPDFRFAKEYKERVKKMKEDHKIIKK